jgi:hypothetical protein
MQVSLVPPHCGQAHAAGWSMRSRGRCAGSGLRTGMPLGGFAAGVTPVTLASLASALALRAAFFQLANLKFELLDLAVELLRRPTEARPPQRREPSSLFGMLPVSC